MKINSDKNGFPIAETVLLYFFFGILTSNYKRWMLQVLPTFVERMAGFFYLKWF
ncbi:MAG: hypothetical protein PHY20_01105 [Bacteroidales bacterium]|jgi:hypothetical protein|nr:hypothetical protein [Bacteroidales bacterium]